MTIAQIAAIATAAASLLGTVAAILHSLATRRQLNQHDHKPEPLTRDRPYMP